jgi:hypothetical protein
MAVWQRNKRTARGLHWAGACTCGCVEGGEFAEYRVKPSKLRMKKLFGKLVQDSGNRNASTAPLVNKASRQSLLGG